MDYATKTLPLDEAIELEAKQNYEYDLIILGGVAEPYHVVEKLYLTQAMKRLCQHGQGYEPEMGHHYLVVVEDCIGGK